jgi:hypothetical protein
MRCAQCVGPRLARNIREGRFCGPACRMDAWYAQRDPRLGTLETMLLRVVAEVRALRQAWGRRKGKRP